MKALIKVGYGCNENCTFCHTLDVRHIDGSAAEVHAKIERAARLGHTMVVLSGGEPTTRPELLEWAAHVAALGMDLGLVTNGLMLAYRDLVDKLMERRLRYVYQSLHGGSARVHDAMVRTESFDAAFAAVANLAGRGLDYTINAVVTTQNLDALTELVDALLPYRGLVLKFSMVQPKGGGERAFRHLVPRVSDVAERVRAAIAYGLERAAAGGLRFAHDGIPLCLLPGYEHLYDDLKTHDYATMVEIGEPDFFPVDDKNKVQPPPCHGCALRGPCPGLFIGYHDTFGDGELMPVTNRPRSNSFNYVFERLVTTSVGDGCPLRDDGVRPWDRGRHLFVKNGDRIGRFRTETRDFADVEIEAIKHDAGQLYLDVSTKAALDDFAADLLKLTRSSLCATCPEHDHCTGLYEPVRDDVFARDDAYVRAILASLRGAVLDVGCGDGPYDDVLAPLAESGAIRYVGIDPDEQRLATQRQRRPWAELHAAEAEEFAPRDSGSFDHIAILRSWNHLREPRRAIANLVASLRAGGTLTVVDNVAFGLARTPTQARRAESSPARFEHYRNDGAAEAHELLAGVGLRLIDRRDVGAATSNQWLLRFEKPLHAR